MKKFPLLPSVVLALAFTYSAHAQDAAPSQAPAITTILGEVEDTRSVVTGRNRLTVELKVRGSGVSDVASYLGATITAATDDTGRDLLNPEKAHLAFAQVRWSGFPQNLRLELKSPERKAAAIKTLTGFVEVFSAKSDPDAMVKVENFQSTDGEPIKSPALVAAGISITTFSKQQPDPQKPNPGGPVFPIGGAGPNDVVVRFQDPKGKLAGIEFQDADGKKIESSGWSAVTGHGQTTKTYNFSSKLPDAARLVIFVATDKAILKVPFSLENVPLP